MTVGGAAVLRVMRFAFRWTEIEFLMSILSVRPIRRSLAVSNRSQRERGRGRYGSMQHDFHLHFVGTCARAVRTRQTIWCRLPLFAAFTNIMES